MTPQRRVTRFFDFVHRARLDCFILLCIISVLAVICYERYRHYRATQLRERSTWVVSSGAQALAFSPDGTLLAIGEENGALTLWNLELHLQLTSLPGKGSCLRAIYINPEATRIAGADETGLLTIWDVRSRRPLERLKAREADLSYPRFSPKGNCIISSSSSGTIRGWERKAIGPLTSSVRGWWLDRIATDSSQQPRQGTWTLRYHDLGTVQLHFTTGHDLVANCLALSPDRQTIATAGQTYATSLWNAATGARVREFSLDDPASPCNDLAFTPDGHTLIEARGNRIILWDLDSGTNRMFTGPVNEVFTRLAISPDGRTLATISTRFRPAPRTAELLLKLWDIPQGK